nr:MAG TPA: hypothetical protein [Microviridae sp.]
MSSVERTPLCHLGWRRNALRNEVKRVRDRSEYSRSEFV